MTIPRTPRPLSEIRGLIMDMDGVLYRGNAPAPGLVEFFRFIEDRGLRYLLLTNNSTTLPAGYTQKLAAMGVQVPPEVILTSGGVARAYLQEYYPPGTRLYGVCMQPLQDLLLDGTGYEWDERAPQVVVSGGDFAVTYEKLRRA